MEFQPITSRSVRMVRSSSAGTIIWNGSSIAKLWKSVGNETGAVDWIGWDLPNNANVLFGKGRTIQEHQHIGTMRLHMAAFWWRRGWKNTALAAVEKKRRRFPKGLLQRSRRLRGDFWLTQESAVWIEANCDVAREKVTQLFWNRRDVAKSKKKEGKAITGVIRPGHSREF
jgi:hypothetical protein